MENQEVQRIQLEERVLKLESGIGKEVKSKFDEKALEDIDERILNLEQKYKTMKTPKQSTENYL